MVIFLMKVRRFIEIKAQKLTPREIIELEVLHFALVENTITHA